MDRNGVISRCPSWGNISVLPPVVINALFGVRLVLPGIVLSVLSREILRAVLLFSFASFLCLLSK